MDQRCTASYEAAQSAYPYFLKLSKTTRRCFLSVQEMIFMSSPPTAKYWSVSATRQKCQTETPDLVRLRSEARVCIERSYKEHETRKPPIGGLGVLPTHLKDIVLSNGLT